MSDDPPKKRSWFQIHLSTAVVLMVVAGVLLWINWDFHDRIVEYYTDQERGIHMTYVSTLAVCCTGVWSAAILTAVAVGCEGFIRRREKAV